MPPALAAPISFTPSPSTSVMARPVTNPPILTEVLVTKLIDPGVEVFLNVNTLFPDPTARSILPSLFKSPNAH